MSELKTNTSKPPAWVRDHLEGQESEARYREYARLEARLPGITRIFEGLLHSLPDPNGVYRKPSEFPVAACIVRKGSDGRLEVVSRAMNRVNELGDPTAHAETEAIREAAAKNGSKHLLDHFIFSTLEPCVQCCGAIVNAGLAGVVYGAEHSDVRGRHALVGYEFKPFRTSPPESFVAESYLTDSGLLVVSGFMQAEAAQAIQRTPVTITEYYRDPDA